ncbi:MAG: hypothetical protein O2887_12730 [Bacteroidetes bacterium]|nr:hypothetical protein [Bacteroidota bacterium]MDA1121333.1 hypothetical protein [Bacteroidota bacterium]
MIKHNHFSEWLLGTNYDWLKIKMQDILIQSNIDILDFSEHEDTRGSTGIWIIPHGSLSLHTFPFRERTFIELSCFDHAKYLDFIINFREFRQDNFGQTKL